MQAEKLYTHNESPTLDSLQLYYICLQTVFCTPWLGLEYNLIRNSPPPFPLLLQTLQATINRGSFN